MSKILTPFGQPDYSYAELRDCVHFDGGPPCLIVETMGDEAIIRSVIDGQEFMVAKKDLKDAKFYVR